MTETCVVCANGRRIIASARSVKAFSGIDVGSLRMERYSCAVRRHARYYGHPEATEAVINAGWFATGDVAIKTRRPHLHHGSKERSFKLSNGKYIAPQQLESLLKQSDT